MTIELDESVYPIGVVQKALYALARRAAGSVRRVSPGRLAVTLECTSDGVDGEQLRREFLLLLADYSVRAQIDQETRHIRELIFAKALAASGALDDPPPGDDRDPVERRRAEAAAPESAP